jgi:hypothetical protein
LISMCCWRQSDLRVRRALNGQLCEGLIAAGLGSWSRAGATMVQVLLVGLSGSVCRAGPVIGDRYLVRAGGLAPKAHYVAIAMTRSLPNECRQTTNLCHKYTRCQERNNSDEVFLLSNLNGRSLHDPLHRNSFPPQAIQDVVHQRLRDPTPSFF